MTVAELIEALRKMPPDAHVWADGIGAGLPVTGAEIDWWNNVTIRVQD